MLIQDKMKETVYVIVSVGEISQTIPTAEFKVSGTDCYGSCLCVINLFIQCPCL